MKSAIGHQIKNVNDEMLFSYIRWPIANGTKTHKPNKKKDQKKTFCGFLFFLHQLCERNSSIYYLYFCRKNWLWAGDVVCACGLFICVFKVVENFFFDFVVEVLTGGKRIRSGRFERIMKNNDGVKMSGVKWKQ